MAWIRRNRSFPFNQIKLVWLNGLSDAGPLRRARGKLISRRALMTALLRQQSCRSKRCDQTRMGRRSSLLKEGNATAWYVWKIFAPGASFTPSIAVTFPSDITPAGYHMLWFPPWTPDYGLEATVVSFKSSSPAEENTQTGVLCLNFPTSFYLRIFSWLNKYGNKISQNQPVWPCLLLV